MTQWMLAIWSLVPLPFLHPAGTSESLDSYKYVAFIFLRESIPRQVDKKSRVTKEEKGVWGFQGGHGVWNSQGGGKDKLEWSSLVPGSEAKFSSLSITNLTSFTISYHYQEVVGPWFTVSLPFSSVCVDVPLYFLFSTLSHKFSNYQTDVPSFVTKLLFVSGESSHLYPWNAYISSGCLGIFSSPNFPFILKIPLFFSPQENFLLCCVCDYSLFSIGLLDALWKSCYLHLRVFMSLISLMISISLSIVMCFRVVLSSDYLGHKLKSFDSICSFLQCAY